MFKIFINTNYLPNVMDMTLFESGRLKVIPFKRHFEEHEQDKGLKRLFAESQNLSGIFNWVLQGLRDQIAEGAILPNPPQAVLDATEEYRKDSDRFGQFMEAWLEPGKDADGSPFEVRTMAVYRVYKKWCDDYNYKPDSLKNFRPAISRKYKIHLQRPKDGGEKVSLIIGCRLRSTELGKEEGDDDTFYPSEDELCEFRKL